MIAETRQRLAELCVDIVGADNVASDPATLACHSYDAFLVTAMPDLVVTVRSTSQIAPLVRVAVELGVPVVVRGAATGYCGGTVPIAGGLVLVLTSLRGLEI